MSGFNVFMLGFIVVAVAAWMVRHQKRKEKAADDSFRAIMLALEEKAKREGTFKVSFFDKEEHEN